MSALPIEEPPPEYPPEEFPPREEPKPDPYQPPSPIWGPGHSTSLLTIGPVVPLGDNQVVGAVVEIARQWAGLGANGATTWALTDSETAHIVGPRLRQQLSNVFCWPWSGSSESLLNVPSGTSRAVAAADVVLVCPLLARDRTFVMQLLRLAKRSVLLLSDDQIHHREDAVRLCAHATCVVMSGSAATTLTGKSDGVAAIRWLRDRGAKNIVLRSSNGETLAYIDRDWHFVPLFKVSQVARADDAQAEAVFVATLVNFLTETSNAREALLMAQAATTLFLEGSNSELTEETLLAVRERPFATFRPAAQATTPRRQLLEQMARPLTAAASWLMALLTWSRGVS